MDSKLKTLKTAYIIEGVTECGHAGMTDERTTTIGVSLTPAGAARARQLVKSIGRQYDKITIRTIVLFK